MVKQIVQLIITASSIWRMLRDRLWKAFEDKCNNIMKLLTQNYKTKRSVKEIKLLSVWEKLTKSDIKLYDKALDISCWKHLSTVMKIKIGQTIFSDLLKNQRLEIITYEEKRWCPALARVNSTSVEKL